MKTESSQITIDQLIDARWMIPVEPAGSVLEGHSLAVHDGRILDLLPTPAARQRYRPKRHLVLDQHAVMPGLINLHTHAAMSLLRGFADDLPLMQWLEQHIWPAEAKHLSADFVRDGSLLACWEMLAGGVTCFNDMYFFPEATADAVLASGIRAALGITVVEFPGAYARHADEYLDKGLAAHAALRHHPLLSFTLAPHAPYTVSNHSFERIAALASDHDLPIHLHLHETLTEIEGSLREHNDERPLARLHRLGIVNRRLIGVHAVHLTSAEINMLAQQGCHVAHCPTSNMKLASGISPVPALLAAGVNVGLGTDSAASNNRLDMFHEMRHAALLAKVGCGDAAALPAHTALHMATLAGARALGLDHEIGSLIPGKQADLIAVKLDTWRNAPCYDPASHLVYVAGREDVTHTWVAGTLRIDDKNPIDFPLDILERHTRLWQNTLKHL